MITGMLLVTVVPEKVAWLAEFKLVPVYAPVNGLWKILSIAAWAAARKADEPTM
jgi:hypothetical protein